MSNFILHTGCTLLLDEFQYIIDFLLGDKYLLIHRALSNPADHDLITDILTEDRELNTITLKLLTKLGNGQVVTGCDTLN